MMGDDGIAGPRLESQVPEFRWGLFFSGIAFGDRVFEGRQLDFLWFVEETNDFVELVHFLFIMQRFSMKFKNQ